MGYVREHVCWNIAGPHDPDATDPNRWFVMFQIVYFLLFTCTYCSNAFFFESFWVKIPFVSTKWYPGTRSTIEYQVVANFGWRVWAQTTPVGRNPFLFVQGFFKLFNCIWFVLCGTYVYNSISLRAIQQSRCRTCTNYAKQNIIRLSLAERLCAFLHGGHDVLF